MWIRVPANTLPVPKANIVQPVMLEEKLKELIEFARDTDLQEVIWQKNGTKISFKRDTAPLPAPAIAESNPALTEEAVARTEPLYIRSTMVGTFYRGDTSDRPPLVVEGTQITSGQAVGSIEAMKIRKDVVSQLTGRIVRSLVADGHSVEYGQPLFEVELENGNGR